MFHITIVITSKLPEDDLGTWKAVRNQVRYLHGFSVSSWGNTDSYLWNFLPQTSLGTEVLTCNLGVHMAFCSHSFTSGLDCTCPSPSECWVRVSEFRALGESDWPGPWKALSKSAPCLTSCDCPGDLGHRRSSFRRHGRGGCSWRLKAKPESWPTCLFCMYALASWNFPREQKSWFQKLMVIARCLGLGQHWALLCSAVI